MKLIEDHRHSRLRRVSVCVTVMNQRLYSGCIQEIRSGSEAKARALLLAVGEQEMDACGKREVVL